MESKTYFMIGDEWAPRQDTIYIIENFILPFVSLSSTVAEIGVGGGRIAREVCPHVAHFDGYDISPVMLQRCSDILASAPHSHLYLLESPQLTINNKPCRARYDFIYSYAREFLFCSIIS